MINKAQSMGGVQRLANLIATAVAKATSTVGMAERAIISGDTVATDNGTYNYDLVAPINVYEGKQVWIQRTSDGNAIVIGD